MDGNIKEGYWWVRSRLEEEPFIVKVKNGGVQEIGWF